MGLRTSSATLLQSSSDAQPLGASRPTYPRSLVTLSGRWNRAFKRRSITCRPDSAAVRRYHVNQPLLGWRHDLRQARDGYDVTAQRQAPRAHDLFRTRGAYPRTCWMELRRVLHARHGRYTFRASFASAGVDSAGSALRQW